jgi:hypothetical protein
VETEIDNDHMEHQIPQLPEENKVKEIALLFLSGLTKAKD